ncbi:MAG: hypothetical protein Q4G59_08640 [Planctomycetia bacterium]|nr:hypothetical protein [Planctomycetia bacterium]
MSSMSMSEEFQMYSDLFSQAVAIAKEHDKIQPECDITEEMMIGYLQKAFPKMTLERATELAKAMFEETNR